MTFRLVAGEWVRVDIEPAAPAAVAEPPVVVVEADFDERDLRRRVAPQLMQYGYLFLTLAAPSSMPQRVITALKPLTDLIAATAYPICYLGMGCGMILIMLGQKHRGMQWIKNAAIGYIGIQFLPTIMSILVEIAQAMSAAPTMGSGGGVR